MKKIILSILGADHYLSPGRGGGEGGGGVRGDVGGFWMCQERLYAGFVTRRVRYMFATKIPNSLPLLICSHNFSLTINHKQYL